MRNIGAQKVVKKVSKKELKKLLKEQEERYQEFINGYTKLEEYKKLDKEFNNLREKLNAIRHKWIADNRENQQNCYEEILYLKNQLAYVGQLDPSKYSEKIKKVYDYFYRGFSCHHKRQLIWVSEDENYILMKNPSSTEYCDRMTGSRSSPSTWLLIDVKKAIDIGTSIRGNHHKAVIYGREGGRWSKDFEKEIVNQIIKYEN